MNWSGRVVKDVGSIINTLAEAGVHVFVSDGKLKTRSLKGALSPEIIALIKNNKERIIKAITERKSQLKTAIGSTDLIKLPNDQREFKPSFGQQRLWFINKMEGGSSHYNLPHVVELKGRFDVLVAEQAFQQIIERHESLRTLFVEEKSLPFLVVSDTFDFAITQIDLKEFSRESQKKQLAQIIQKDASKAFDLNKDIMLRVSYVYLEENHGVLLMNMHHIASDGWSIGVLHHEFSKLYHAIQNKITGVLKPLNIQYHDYAHWQFKSSQEIAFKQQVNYWLQQLDDMPQVHSVPLDHQRTESPSLLGQVYEFSLDETIFNGLKILSKKQKTTVFMILHAAFVVLLSRYSNSNDIVVGTPVANRSKKALEGLIGYFVNTLVLRVDCSENPNFIDLLQHVKEVNLSALNNQDVPFEHLVEQLNPQRDTSYNTLFQIMFMMDANNVQPIDLDGVVVQQIANENIPAKFDLTLNVTSESNRFKCTFLYKKDLFDESTIRRLSNSLKLLLKALVIEPKTHISELPLLTVAEENYLTNTLNDTDADFSSISCVHQLFEAQTVKTPNNTAVIFENYKLSYLEFNRKCNQLAHYLIGLGVKPDDFVGLYFERSIEMMTAVFAVMKAGGAYLPLDPGLPQDRLASMVVDSEAKILLTTSSLQNNIEEINTQTIAIDTDKNADTFNQRSSQNPKIPALNPKHAAYMIYTSGSTGKPKGVIVEHRNVVNYMYAIDHYLDDRDGAIFVTNYSFDGTVTVLLSPLIKGLYIKIIAENDDKFRNLANDLCSHQQKYIFKLTPSYIDATRSLVTTNKKAQHTFILGGESLYAETHHFWSNLLPESTFLNHYGPTETTVGSSTFFIGKKKHLSYPKGIPIGKPLANTQFYILNDSLQLTPFGSIGELYIGGLGLARGYKNQAELTQKCFISNPFSKNPDSRLYRTGDLVRYFKDGNIDFLGRTDFQVKLRGLRIELGEIENCLNELNCVEQCFVMLHQSKSNEKHLLAYLTTPSKLDHEDLIGKVKSQLLQTLPVYMVPSHFVVLDKMPLNSSGKVSRKSLPQPDTQLLSMGTIDFEVPKTNTERGLIEIWSDLLKISTQNISRKANFFELGGHSLLSVRLVAELRDVFSVELSIRDIFNYPQVLTLAKVIETNDKTILKKVTLYERKSSQLECSYAQQRLWFIDKMDQDCSHYNMPAVMQTSGNLCLDTAEQAFIRIINRHEPLRTVFIESDVGVKQIVQGHFDFKINRINLIGNSEKEQEQKIFELAQEDARKPFDLSVDLMLRISHIALSNNEGVMLFNMHHIASDGWSVGILTKEFSLQYTAIYEGKPDSLAPLKVQYADYAQWQRHWLRDGVLENQLQYWQNQLVDLPILHQLPLDAERPLHQSYHGQSYDFEINLDTLVGLKKSASQQNVTLFMIIHASFALMLARYSNCHDIVIGTPVANRKQKEFESLIGFFVNSLVLRVNSSNDSSFKDFLQQVKQVNLDAQANQDVPFEFLVDLLSPARSTAHNALFQIMLSMNNLNNKELMLPEVSLVPGLTAKDLGEVKAKFDLLLDCYESEYGMVFSFVYSTDLFAAETIEKFAASFIRVLETVLKDPIIKLSKLPIVDHAEKQYLTEVLNNTQTNYPSEICIHQLFEQQVVNLPEHPAVTFGHKSLSYSTLNSKANKLAHFLITQGVVPDEFVGICIDRSVEMFIGIIAILKAGAAYLPLDPTYPQERLNYMMDDSDLSWVITTKKLKRITQGKNRKQCILDDPNWYSKLTDYSTNNLSIDSLTAKNLAYVIYTSGSTGMPKGVMIEHHQVINMLEYFKEQAPCSANFNASLWTSLSFDVSVFEVFSALLYGGHLRVPDDEIRQSPIEYFNWMSDKNIKCAYLPPFYIKGFCQWLEKNNTLSLERLLVGVEPIDESLLRTIASIIPTVTIINGYGPTETTVCCTTYNLKNSLPGEQQGYAPIGKPMANYSVFILDENLNVLPKGTVGELYIGGIGLARGYLNQTALSAEKFIQSPFSDKPFDRLYKSGDLVRYRKDSNLEFIGRTDDQVKIRGYRIELGEIERQLLNYPDITSTVVVVDKNKEKQKRLVAYICSDNEIEQTQLINNIRTYLETHIPSFMIPSLFIVLKDIPITVNGKVDKKALPKPDFKDVLSTYSAPESEVEKSLCAIWSEVLHLPIEHIGIDSNFFELGGDSILSIQVVSRATAAGLNVTVKQLFEYQNIRNLSLHINQRNSHPIPDKYVTGDMQLLPIQQRFFSSSVALDHYNQTVLLQTPADFNLSLLKQIVELLYKRHDALRLRFARVEGKWKATHIELSKSMIEETLGEMVLDDMDFVNLGIQAESFQTSLSISHGPLFRAVYCTNKAGDGRLLIIIHHLVVDGVSWRIIMDDIECLYKQYSSKETLILPPKSSSYQSWGAFLSSEKQLNYYLTEYNYWNEVVTQSIPDLPRLKSHSEDNLGFGQVEFKLNEETTSVLLSQASSAYRTQANELLLSALLLGFYKWSGNQTIKIDSEGHGRQESLSEIDMSQTVGWFTSLFPLVLKTESIDLSSLVCAVKEYCRAVPNKGLGYGILQYLSQEKSFKNKKSPILFNYLGQVSKRINEINNFSMATENTGHSISLKRQAEYDLTFNGIVLYGELSFTLNYNQNSYADNDANKLMVCFETALREIISHCSQPETGKLTPSDFPLTTVTQQQLDNWQNKYFIEDIYPATAMQQGLLYHSTLNDSAYVTQLMFTLAQGTDIKIFKQAWQNTINQHAILKTAFVSNVDGELYQLVNPKTTLPWTECDIKKLDQSKQLTEIEKYRREDKSKGFDINQAPLLRLHVWHLGQNSYRVLVSNHHALLDGWSMPLVFTGIFKYYQAEYMSHSLVLPPSVPYRYYLKWISEQNDQLAKDFWKQELLDVEEPTVVLSPQYYSFKNKKTPLVKNTIEFNQLKTKQLQELVSTCQVTLNTLLQGAWALLLSRYTNQKTVVFGVTVSGRPATLPNVEQMVGLFINTVPVRINLDNDLSIKNWFKQLHSKQITRDEYSYLPLVDIQAQSNIDINSITDNHFVFENYPLDENQFNSNQHGQLQVSDILGYEETEYSLSVTATLKDTLTLKFFGQNNGFTDGFLQQLGHHLTRIIEGMLKGTHQLVHQLSMLSIEEEQNLVKTLNQCKLKETSTWTVHQLFEKQVKKTPNNPAVILDGVSLNYRELNEKANRLAHVLLVEGVGSDQLIGVYFERSLNMMVAILAILKAGAAYVPLDPASPHDHLKHIIEDSCLTFLITQKKLESDLTKKIVRPLFLDDKNFKTKLQSCPVNNPVIKESSLNHLAYVIYTSGSTGQPKGVMIEHQCVSQHITTVINKMTFTSDDRFLQFTSMSFDAFVEQTFSSLLVGGILHLRGEEVWNVEEFYTYTQEHGITVTDIPPVYLKELLSTNKSARDYWTKTPLTRVIVGGESLSKTLVERWFELNTEGLCQLYNAYGPTETTITSHMTEICNGDLEISIGASLPGRTSYILDQYQKLTPNGQVGELYIGGTGLARGYIKQPELTKKQFINYEFSDGRTERLYRTGDLVRHLKQGKLAFMGRIDKQVKVRGFRVELSEIEHVLSAYPGIKTCVVEAFESPQGQSMLCAYYEEEPSNNKSHISIKQLKTFLAKKLPQYMVPSICIQLDSIPVNVNGKIDRRSLPAPDESSLDTEYVTPDGDIENQLTVLWAEVLGMSKQRISADANFFEIGGHSLLAVKLLTKIKNTFEVNLKMNALFELPSLSILAKHLAMLTDSADNDNDRHETEQFEI